MRPSLEKILSVALKVFMMSEMDWEILKYTRAQSAVQIVQAVSLIAYENGYRVKTIGKFLERDRTTVLYSISKIKEQCSIYRDCCEAIQQIREILNYEHFHSFTGYLARNKTGLLTISPTPPERMAGFWIAEGTKPYNSQGSFPQITWECEPVKVKIKVTIESNEKM